jgi:hypothetical protein
LRASSDEKSRQRELSDAEKSENPWQLRVTATAAHHKRTRRTTPYLPTIDGSPSVKPESPAISYASMVKSSAKSPSPIPPPATQKPMHTMCPSPTLSLASTVSIDSPPMCSTKLCSSLSEDGVSLRSAATTTTARSQTLTISSLLSLDTTVSRASSISSSFFNGSDCCDAASSSSLEHDDECDYELFSSICNANDADFEAHPLYECFERMRLSRMKKRTFIRDAVTLCLKNREYEPASECFKCLCEARDSDDVACLTASQIRDGLSDALALMNEELIADTALMSFLAEMSVHWSETKLLPFSDFVKCLGALSSEPSKGALNVLFEIFKRLSSSESGSKQSFANDFFDSLPDSLPPTLRSESVLQRINDLMERDSEQQAQLDKLTL